MVRCSFACFLATACAIDSWPWVADSGSHSFGQHRVIIQLPAATAGTAVWAQVPWQRRPIPNASTTDAVLTVAATGEVVANALRVPIAGVAESEAVNFVFEPVLEDNWIVNRGTADDNIVTGCSGAYSTTPCWKVADGRFDFDYNKGEGWDGEPEPGTTLEWLEFDLGAVETLDRIGVYSVGRSEDAHYPEHNPAEVAVFKRDSTTDAWQEFFNATASEAPTNVLSWRDRLGGVDARFLRLEIRSRHVASQNLAHSWLKEVQFGRYASEPTVVTDYALYYMPYSWTGHKTGLSYQTHYDPVNETASVEWRQEAGLTDEVLANQSYQRLPEAKFVALQAATPFDDFEPMEIVARQAGIDALLAAHGDDVLWFPEDRKNQVKMSDVVPQRWVDAGPSRLLQGTADPGEMLALQLGVWAVRKDLVLDASNVTLSDLKDAQGRPVIPAANISCYNLGGRDYQGKRFAQSARVEKGHVGALWFGVAVPDTVGPVALHGELVIGDSSFNIEVLVTANETIPNAGADDVWRMSRLSWLDSTIGIDRNITAGYGPVAYTADGGEASVVLTGGKSLVIASNAGGDVVPLVRSVAVKGQQVLSAPLSFSIQDMSFEATSAPHVLQHDDMTVTFSQQTASSDGSVILNSTIVVSYDGFVDATVSLTASKDTSLQGTSLSLDISEAASTFLMGLSVQGRNRSLMYPDGVTWNWKSNPGGQNQLWAGSVDAGLRLKFKGDEYDWESPLHMQSEAPRSWAGDATSGSIAALPRPDGSLRITAQSGPVTLSTQKPLAFKFDLVITPLKTLNTALHFRRDRYYQFGYAGHYGGCDEIASMGTQVLNLHQGTVWNPYINYPFDKDAMERQANFSQTCKSLGVQKTKIYYTTRELSNRCYELPTLKAIATSQDHVFDEGAGGGPSWLHEHLGDWYGQRWSNALADGGIDASISDTSLSRWVNYYIAGLQWLSENHPGTASIDGLYLDEVSFDRATMQRMRKAVDAQREGSLFDLHSCNKFHCGHPPDAPKACSALIYMAHFAFIDLLWYGEGFSPNYAPDQWLVEMSGIPFGLHAEQLSSPNLWRGMVFAEGARPAPNLWAAWDSLELTSDGTQLVGWWDASVPVRTDNPDVLVSVYLRPGKGCVLAVASWAAQDAEVTLQIDWRALSLDPESVSITAPSIKDFQDAATVSTNVPTIMVKRTKGWLLDLKSSALYV